MLLHTIGESFFFASSDGASNDQLAWLVSGFALTVGTFVLVSGRLGDVFGYKRMLLVGYSWFALWSVVVGFSVWSNSYVLIVFARVLQGIGPATCKLSFVPSLLSLLPCTSSDLLQVCIFTVPRKIALVSGSNMCI